MRQTEEALHMRTLGSTALIPPADIKNVQVCCGDACVDATIEAATEAARQ